MFIENVKEEADEVIQSLRQHPSLVLWTGKLTDDIHGKENSLKRTMTERIALLDPSRPLVNSEFTDEWAINQ